MWVAGNVDDGVVEVGFAQQHRGEADVVGDAEELVQAGLSEVAADDDDVLSCCRHRVGQVGADGRLAVGGAGAGDQQRLDRVVDGHELDRRSDRAKCLGGRPLGLLSRDEQRDPPVGPLGDVGDQAEHRHARGDLLEIRPRPDLVVDGLLEECDRDADRQPDQTGQEDVGGRLRADRLARWKSVTDLDRRRRGARRLQREEL